MITVTQKMEHIEAMKFLVTIIKTTNENVIAIAIPWNALSTKARSTATEVQALEVYFIPFIVLASVSARLFSSSTNTCHFSMKGALCSPGVH
jgi:hypothetical protein